LLKCRCCVNLEKALEYHPDKILETKRQKKNLRKLLRLTRFYDASKKAKYDQYGHKPDGSGGFGGGHGGMNMDDIFSQFGDIFGSAFGGGGGFEAVVEASVELKEVTYVSK
jgi:molecular chaperone DnaJ